MTPTKPTERQLQLLAQAALGKVTYTRGQYYVAGSSDLGGVRNLISRGLLVDAPRPWDRDYTQDVTISDRGREVLRECWPDWAQ